jgi:hypothetical protein
VSVSQAQRVIQLAVSQQPGIGSGRGTAKLQQQTTIEIQRTAPLSASALGSHRRPHSNLQVLEIYSRTAASVLEIPASSGECGMKYSVSWKCDLTRDL